MKIKPALILKNLSAISFIIIYFVIVIVHLISDSFLLTDQVYLIILMCPFILIGLALDYILRYNKAMKTVRRIIIQLMPLGVFVMMFISTIMLYYEEKLVVAFNYLIWFFVSLPFFMASYEKEGLRPRLLRSLIGTGAVVVAYMFLTTQTDMLNKNYGALVIIISYFFMLYVASGIKKLPNIGLAAGLINAIVYILMRYYPSTDLAKTYGWDFDISNKVELLIILTFIFCILVRIYEVVLLKKNDKNEHK